MLLFNSSLLLLGRCSLLRSLECISCLNAGKPTTLARRSLGLGDEHETVARTGDCAFNHEEIVFKIDAANAKVADRDLCVAHVTRHALTGKHAGRKRRGADRTLHLEHVAVRLGTAAEAMAANNAGKTAALGSSNNVDELLIVEDVNHDAVASLNGN